MSDSIKQSVIELMHKTLLATGVNALQECVVLLQKFELAGDPILKLSVISAPVAPAPVAEVAEVAEVAPAEVVAE